MRTCKGLNKAIADPIGEYLVASGDGASQMHLSGSGAVAEVEDKLKQHYRMRYALCVSNGTAGLLAIALALDLKNSEFVTTPYTYGGSLASWLLLGNRPVFADIDPVTLTLNCESVRKAISPKSKAVLAVDIFGNPSDTVALRRLADEFGLWYVADAAQSLGAYRDDRPASALADALVLSFTAGKTVFAGEGGAVLTNNEELYQKMIWHTQHPTRQCRELGLHLSNEFAVNARIHPLAAVWVDAVFEQSLCDLAAYQKQCFRLIRALNLIGLTEPIHFERHGIVPSFFRFTASWNDQPQEETLLRELRERGFSVTTGQPLITLLYQQAAYTAQYAARLKKRYRCPEAERQARHRFCIMES